MKQIKLATLAIATVTLLPSLTSCKSDPNPFDITITPGNTQNESAFIRLNLRVEGTRADESPAVDNLATAAEKEITNVSIYVFNEKHELEICERAITLGESDNRAITLGESDNSVVLPVSPGLKTIYAITAESGVNPSIGTTFADFENLTFDSTLDKLKTEAGHMMIGKSDEQQVMLSATQNEMPASNNFSIKLTRAVAKAQVKYGELDGSSFGLTLGTVSFKAKQTCDMMMVVHKGSDIFSMSTNSNNNGTYDNYSLREAESYQNGVTEDFTAAGCEYMPENIVTNPLNGNTTFLSIKIATTPQKYYSFAATDNAPQTIEETPVAGANYYVVGIVDRAHGVSDYTVGSDGHIITFKDEEDAQRYMSLLNNGEVSSMTVSQTESLMRAPSTRAGETESAQFEVFTFVNGEAYYRVNIAHTEGNGDYSTVINKVVRNKFYKVYVNSVNSLGFSAESLLCPTDPSTELDAKGSAWISASFIVDPWKEVRQEVDL